MNTPINYNTAKLLKEKQHMDTNGNYIQNQFCSYEIALKLKELGFDEECLCTYGIENKSFQRNPSNNMAGEEIEEPYTWKNSLIHQSVMTAPLWQQVIDWFREKKNLNIEIRLNQDGGYQYNICDVRTPMITLIKIKKIKSFDEAREQAILKAFVLC